MKAFVHAFRYCVVALLAWATSPVFALTEVTGTTPGGAAYRIAVPDGWEAGDPLVLVQREYSQNPVVDPSLGPLRDTQLEQGMAVAATGYRQTGWALFRALDDNAELLEEFSRRFGAPGALYATGQKMGGLVALKLAEDPRFRDATRGVLALCPVSGGVEHWDNAFDVRLIYDTACAGAQGGALPLGTVPYPWALDLDDIPAGLGTFDGNDPALIAALPAVTQCTGLGLAESARSASQRQRLLEIQSRTDIGSERALIAMLAYATFGLGDLLRSPDQLALRNPFFNETLGISQLWSVRYNPSAFNDAVRRVRQENPFARFDFERASALDGNATARIVNLHTSKDEVTEQRHDFMFIGYPYARFHPRGRVGATIWEDSASHCTVSPAEVHAGWDVLLNSASSGSDLPGSCAARVALGKPGPCRFVRPPSASVASTNLRIRQEFTPPQKNIVEIQPSSGFWFDPARSGEGLVIEELGSAIGFGKFLPAAVRRVVVTWYTFAPPGDPEPGPRWLVGVGFQTGQGVHVPMLTLTRGARFGAAFDPADVERIDWGSLSLTVDAQHRMQVRYQGLPGWEGSERQATLLAGIAFPTVYSACCIDPPPPDQPLDTASASGSYFSAARDGEGIQFHVAQSAADVATLRAVVAYYTYDTEGQQLWLVGSTDEVPRAGGDVTIPVVRAHGTVFGDTFDPLDVVREPWGTVTVTVAPGASSQDPFVATALRWNAVDLAYGSGGYALTRITRPSVNALTIF